MLDTIEKNGYTYYQLFLSCPICYEKGNLLPQVFWQHHDCSGHLYIGDNAHIYCVKCETDKAVTCWIIDDHNDVDDDEMTQHENTFSLADDNKKIGIAIYIAMAGQIATLAGFGWIQKFLENLED